jgi:hypothetical protein
MDTALTPLWEYLTEKTETTETFARFEALDLASVLAGCIADVGFATTDKHQWAARQLCAQPRFVPMPRLRER